MYLRFRTALTAGLIFAAVAHSANGSPPNALAPNRLEAISRRYLGTPYKLDCLGEAIGPDRDPLFTRRYADCQTLVEQVMAEALAGSQAELPQTTRRIRYRNGEVRLENRFHYCIPDWLEQPWPARDVTPQVAGRALKTVRRRIDLPTFLASRGGNPARAPSKARWVTAGYLPRAQVKSRLAGIPDGSIAIFVIEKPGIVSGHTGFLFRQGSTVMLRHASQTRKKVIDEPLTAYLARAPRRTIGMMVLQPDLAGLQRR
jgi:hypothetical protein